MNVYLLSTCSDERHIHIPPPPPTALSGLGRYLSESVTIRRVPSGSVTWVKFNNMRPLRPIRPVE